MLTRFLIVSLSFCVSLQAGQYIVELLSPGVDAGIARRGAKVTARTSRTVHTLITDIDDADLYPVASHPTVKRLYPVVTYKPTGDVIEATQAISQVWDRVGGEDRAGAGIKIGIIDTGIDATHPGLAANGLEAPAGYPRVDNAKNRRHTSGKVIVARSYERFNGKGFGTDAGDIYGHGTGSAMISAGVRHEAPEGTVSGVAPRAFVGNYKVIGDDASGTSAGILKAIDDAVADGMDVINLSLGSAFAPRPEDDIIVQALERAIDQGVIVVVAAGNAGPGLNSISSPGTAPRAITVGAHTATQQLAWFSGRGPNLGDGLKPDLLAVGDQFYTADTLQRPGSTGYRTVAGTSLAAPIAAGLAAILKAERPGLAVRQYRSLLINSATALPFKVVEGGAGKLDGTQALAATLTAAPSSLKLTGQGATLTVEPVSGSAGLCTVDAPGLTLSATQFVGDAPFSLRVEANAPEGFVTVSCEGAAQKLRVPYWRPEVVGAADSITTIDLPRSAPRGAAIDFGLRVVDTQGLVVAGAVPTISVQGGTVLRAGWNSTVPGLYQLQLRVQSDVTLQVRAGSASREVSVRAY
ncbi:MAG: S8 family serine peptidase [Bryobacteraceae bacterium]|nr:S8 family serine peptidase [Bryobacteraceae bacterium]